MRHALILAACLALPCSAQELQPEPPIQEQIQKIASARNPSQFAAELEALNESVSDKGEIVKQLAIYAGASDERSTMAAVVILRKLDFPPIIVVRVLAPHLDADNKNLRSFVRNWFRQHDNGGTDESPLKPVNYEDYEKYVRGNKNPPVPFVEYIYERSPYRALIVFYRALGQRDAAVAALQAEAREVEAARRELANPDAPVARQPAREPQPPENREVLLAAHNVENAIWLRRNGFAEQFQQALPGAKEKIAKLSEHKEWWVRLYVAEIMRRHPELRLPEVLEKLSGDENSSVSKAAGAVKQSAFPLRVACVRR